MRPSEFGAAIGIPLHQLLVQGLRVRWHVVRLHDPLISGSLEQAVFGKYLEQATDEPVVSVG